MHFDGGGRRHSVVPEAAFLSTELIEDEATVSTSSTDRMSRLAGAAVGGLAFGTAGALVGALTGKRNSRAKAELSEIRLILTINDRQHPSFQLQLFQSKKPILKTSAQGRKALHQAQDADALMAVITRQSAAA